MPHAFFVLSPIPPISYTIYFYIKYILYNILYIPQDNYHRILLEQK